MTKALHTLEPEGSSAQFGVDRSGEIRRRFLHADRDANGSRRIFFENAGGSLRLETAVAAASQASSLPDNAGRDNPDSCQVGRVIERGLADMMAFFGASKGVVLAGHSTSSDVFRLLDTITAQAVRSGKNGNLVCTNLDHPCVYDGTTYFARLRGLERRVAELDPVTGRVPPEAVARLVDGNTLVVVCIHASNILGAKNDLQAIVDAVRRRAPQAFVIGDGAQHAQHGLVDVAAWGVDAYLVASYKLFSKPGMSFAWLNPRLAMVPHWKLAGHPDAHWQLGTVDPGGFAAISAVMDYLCWLSGRCATAPRERRAGIVAALQAIERHEDAGNRRLLEGNGTLTGLAHLPRVRVLGEAAAGPEREAVFAFCVAGHSASQVVRRCAEAGVVVHSRHNDAYSGHTLRALGVEECVRVSLAHYNTPAEIDVFLEVMNAIGR